MIPLIDTHQHLWDLSRLRLDWPQGAPALNRSFLMSDYQAVTVSAGIAGTVYMEVDAHPDSRDQEIADMTAHCQDPNTPMLGLVASADPDAPTFPEWLQQVARNPFVKGCRRVLHGASTPPGHALTPEFVSGVQALGQQGLLFDVCIRPAELTDAAELARRCPETTIILDHCGNADPYVVAGLRDPEQDCPDPVYFHTRKGWLEGLEQVAAQPNTVCKISGIIARAEAGWSLETLAPTLEACLGTFGEDRVIFGGDWPVCTLGAPLQDWVTALRTHLQRYPVSFQEKLFYQNAERLYGVSLPASRNP